MRFEKLLIVSAFLAAAAHLLGTTNASAQPKQDAALPPGKEPLLAHMIKTDRAKPEDDMTSGVFGIVRNPDACRLKSLEQYYESDLRELPVDCWWGIFVWKHKSLDALDEVERGFFDLATKKETSLETSMRRFIALQADPVSREIYTAVLEATNNEFYDFLKLRVNAQDDADIIMNGIKARQNMTPEQREEERRSWRPADPASSLARLSYRLKIG